jgi:predicted methyltransferase
MTMTGRNARRLALYAALGLFGGMMLSVQPAKAQDYEALLAAPDRSEADRNTDKRRNPVKLLAFTGAKPGMKVLDMGAGGGYSTELMARAVAPNGVVYGQNSPTPNERAAATFAARMKTPAMQKAVAVARAYDDPVPPEATGLDLITFFFAYHDVTATDVDRSAMNKKMLAALKPGGYFVIADHAAKAGDGTTVGKTLHRIEESALRKEIEAAGFKLVAEGDFLRHPEDPHDIPISKMTTPIDEFVLKFQKPES